MNFLDGLFGNSSSNNKDLIQQLFRLHASLSGALREILEEISPEVGKKFQTRYMELYADIAKTHVRGSYDFYGLMETDEEASEIKVDRPTNNTWEAVFALINNKQDEFKRLIEEGPSPEAVKIFEEQKERAEKTKQERLDRKKRLAALREKQKTCEHEFSSNTSAGFFKLTDSKCIKCEMPNPNAGNKT